jgi:hypothetical protein
MFKNPIVKQSMAVCRLPELECTKQFDHQLTTHIIVLMIDEE